MICLFGGTFDPVHLGHLHAATRVCDTLPAAGIRLLLSARPGHRDAPGASSAHRWAMLELACAGDSRLLPDATELRRAEQIGRPSYTAETLDGFRAEHPEAVINWVIGSDAYREIRTWHRWRDVFELCNLVVLRRPGAVLELDPELAELTRARCVTGPPRARAGGVCVLDADMLDVSATEIRNLLGKPGNAAAVADLLPSAVYTYIKEYHLYGVVSDA